MYCVNCGKRLGKAEKNAKFCSVCGTPLSVGEGVPVEKRGKHLLTLAAGVAAFILLLLEGAGMASLPDAGPGAAALLFGAGALDLAVLWGWLPRRRK